MSQDTFSPAGDQALPGGGAPQRRGTVDRFELKPQWTERTEEELVEAAEALYEKAARLRMPPAAPVEEPVDEEELEAISQELKLQQKCQDIAALIMADEQGLMDTEDEEE